MNQKNKIQTLSVVVPVYNEGRTITRILDKLQKVQLIKGLKKEVILVNDERLFHKHLVKLEKAYIF
jgi:hypothetical protein